MSVDTTEGPDIEKMDLLDRLRNPLWVHGHAPFLGPQLEKEENLEAMKEAADEIERLRAPAASLPNPVRDALEELLAHWEKIPMWNAKEVNASVERARAALAAPRESFDNTDAAKKADYKIGWWLSAALDHPSVCVEMKADIRAWFEAHQPGLVMATEVTRPVSQPFDRTAAPTEHLRELKDAITGLLRDYRTEGCPDPSCGVCRRSKEAERRARAAIDVPC